MALRMNRLLKNLVESVGYRRTATVCLHLCTSLDCERLGEERQCGHGHSQCSYGHVQHSSVCNTVIHRYDEKVDYCNLTLHFLAPERFLYVDKVSLILVVMGSLIAVISSST